MYTFVAENIQLAYSPAKTEREQEKYKQGAGKYTAIQEDGQPMRWRCVDRLNLLIVSLWLAMTMHGQRAASAVPEVLPDSSNFVRASLLVASPTNSFYSIFGHAALRMQCPSFHLDYVFTLENDNTISAFMTGIMGNAPAKYVAVPAAQYIGNMKKLGRELQQYELNLTHHEKQRLWQLLDEDMMAGSYRHFNILSSNCLSTSIIFVQDCLIGEHLEWGAVPDLLNLCDGEVMRYYTRRSPWSEFTVVTFCGTAYNEHSPLERKLSPKVVASLLRDALFVNDSTGESRHVLVASKTKRFASSTFDTHTSFELSCFLTPLVAFSTLLVLVLLLTVAEWKKNWHQPLIVLDFVLFTAQAIVGLLLLYVAYNSEVFGGRWNWYFILFNPLPLLVWSFLRRSGLGMMFWKAYSGLLIIFILATPFVGVLDLPHQLVSAAFFVRCFAQYTYSKSNNQSK